LINRDIMPDNFLVGRPGTKAADRSVSLPSHSGSSAVNFVTSDPHGGFRNGQALSRPQDEAAHTLPQTQESEWNGTMDEHQHSLGKRCDD